MLKPNELFHIIDYAQECFFVIKTKLPDRNYNVAVYKYKNEYFVLNDSAVFRQVQGLNQEAQGDEDELLPYVEEAFDANHYCLVEEKYIKLELNILAIISKSTPVKINYYEFIDFK